MTGNQTFEMSKNPKLAPFKHINASIKLFSSSKYECDCLNAPYRIGESKAFLYCFVSLVYFVPYNSFYTLESLFTIYESVLLSKPQSACLLNCTSSTVLVETQPYFKNAIAMTKHLNPPVLSVFKDFHIHLKNMSLV